VNAPATEPPATSLQIGAINGEFRELGVHDRRARRALAARLAGIGPLGSMTELTTGQAGRLIRELRGTDDLAVLLEQTQ
jgi:hypothetical protein